MPDTSPTLAIVDFFNEPSFEVVKLSSIDKDFGIFEDFNREEVVVIKWKFGKAVLKHHPARIVQFGSDDIQLRQQRNKIVDQCLSVKSLPLMFDANLNGPRDRRPNSKFNVDEDEVEYSPEETAKRVKKQHNEKKRGTSRMKSDATLDVARRMMDEIKQSTLNKENDKDLTRELAKDSSCATKTRDREPENLICYDCKTKDVELSRLKDTLTVEKQRRKSAEKKAELLEKSPELVSKLCVNLEIAQKMLHATEQKAPCVPNTEFFFPPSSCSEPVVQCTSRTNKVHQVAGASFSGKTPVSQSSRSSDKPTGYSPTELVQIGETVSIPKSNFLSLDRTDVTNYTNQLLVFVFGEEQIANSTMKAHKFSNTTKKPINQIQLEEVRAHIIAKFNVDASAVNQKIKNKFGNLNSKSKRLAAETHKFSNTDSKGNCGVAQNSLGQFEYVSCDG